MRHLFLFLSLFSSGRYILCTRAQHLCCFAAGSSFNRCKPSSSSFDAARCNERTLPMEDPFSFDFLRLHSTSLFSCCSSNSSSGRCKLM
uniref:Putative secreted protein n=1 Tax=Anopheles darlingi TaxID=43151 RepID=A0A2M4DPS2_ANODA